MLKIILTLALLFLTVDFATAGGQNDHSNSDLNKCAKVLISVDESIQPIDWDRLKGVAEIPTRPILTPEEAETARSTLNAGRREIIFNLEDRSDLRDYFEPSIAAKLISYLKEIETIVNTQSPQPLRGIVFMRTERSSFVTSGHNHKPQTITFTHALLGPPSWIEKPELQRTSPKTYIFTDEYHGTPPLSEPRFLIIVFFHS